VGLNTALTAIEMPGTTDGTKLLTPTQVSEIVSLAGDLGNELWTTAAPKLNALYARVQTVKVLLDGGANASLLAAMTAFYATAVIEDLFTAAVANAAETAWNEALKANNYSDYVPYDP
jgi:hypothetical protein